ncbi:PilW family protein [Anoxybacillus sp. J5B_2022]|uniref:PilW family protein n=1 Tax=Anoxybacillus sp. J5B_2022 TaxID=3003246 RepID=UPI0022863D65|nr:Tfp pilus assembly protein [Anoxybacillus sp. J5B_2022]MCZ0754769.1 Tfp pilus assembly protein [Anoxybacillus sp. J5B_2022]
MKRFVNNEKGLTLLELLATVTISFLIIGVMYNVFMSGIKTYQRIGIENELRSEADYMMTIVFNRLYEFAPDGIDTTTKTNTQLVFVNNKQKTIDTRVGLVEEQETKTKTKSFSLALQNDQLLIDGQPISSDRLRIISNQSKLSYTCVRQEGNICRSGVVTMVLAVEDSTHDSPSSPLYIRPFTLKTEFGF